MTLPRNRTKKAHVAARIVSTWRATLETVGCATESHGLRENLCDQSEKSSALKFSLTKLNSPIFQDTTSSTCNLNLLPSWYHYHVIVAIFLLTSSPPLLPCTYPTKDT